MSRTGRVLIVVENLPVPYDRRVWREARTLVRAGLCVSVISPSGKSLSPGYYRLDGVHVYRYPILLEGSNKLGVAFEYLWAFACIFVLTAHVGVMSRGFDVIQLCNPPDIFWPITMIWKRLGKAVIFDHHDLAPELVMAKFGGKAGLLYRTHLLLEKLTFRSADFVISTNESYREIAESRGGKSRERVSIVRNGPDPGQLQVIEPDLSWRNGRQHLVVFLGEIGEQDGVDGFIRVACHIVTEIGRRDIQFAILGGGPYFDSTVRQANQYGILDYVTFAGRVGLETINRVLSTANVGVDACPKNAFNDKSTHTKIVEYMFFGLPIVAYDLTETRFSAADAALYVNDGDEIMFADSIVRLIDDPRLAAKLGERGSSRARQELLWDHAALTYVQTVLQVLAYQRGEAFDS